MTLLRGDSNEDLIWSEERGIYGFFGLSWVPITVAPRNNLALLFGRVKALLIAGLSNDSNDMSTRDISTPKYDHAEKRLCEVWARLSLENICCLNSTRSGEGGEEPATMWPRIWVTTIKGPRRPYYNTIPGMLYISVLKTKWLLRISYIIPSIIVACETCLTENGTSPELNSCTVSLIPEITAFIHPNIFCTTRKSLKSTPCLFASGKAIPERWSFCRV